MTRETLTPMPHCESVRRKRLTFGARPEQSLLLTERAHTVREAIESLPL